MSRMTAWLATLTPGRRKAAAFVADLPVYQVALWPDGWELQPDGGVRVRVAGEWIRERRGQLLDAPKVALSESALHWCGSRHDEEQNSASLEALFQELIDLCRNEGMIPDLCYRLRLRCDDGYGLPCFHCTVEAPLTPSKVLLIAEVLMVAIIPWNRFVVRDGQSVPLVRVEGRSASGRPTRESGC